MNNTIPAWWNSKEEFIQNYMETKLNKGKVYTLSMSPGNRPVKAVVYGEPEPELRGTANFNSAIGSGKPETYFKRGQGMRKRPVMIVVSGIHGQEVEGMIGTLSLINMMENKKDITGREQPALYQRLCQTRLIIIPLANPDGRARVPYESWVGLDTEEMTKYGQGTRKNGELYRWRGSKAVHPMKGDIGILGGYFNDDGINMMHDEWSSPMSQTTAALLKLVANEGPDIFLNLHSHSHDPSILPTAYIPVSTRIKQYDISEKLYAKLEKEGYAYVRHPLLREDGAEGKIPPAMNLTSMCYHVGADLSITFESPHGVIDGEHPYQHEDILKIHHMLFDHMAEHLNVI